MKLAILLEKKAQTGYVIAPCPANQACQNFT